MKSANYKRLARWNQAPPFTELCARFARHPGHQRLTDGAVPPGGRPGISEATIKQTLTQLVKEGYIQKLGSAGAAKYIRSNT